MIWRGRSLSSSLVRRRCAKALTCPVSSDVGTQTSQSAGCARATPASSRPRSKSAAVGTPAHRVSSRKVGNLPSRERTALQTPRSCAPTARHEPCNVVVAEPGNVAARGKTLRSCPWRSTGRRSTGRRTCEAARGEAFGGRARRGQGGALSRLPRIPQATREGGHPPHPDRGSVGDARGSCPLRPSAELSAGQLSGEGRLR